jgi:hypothetical protein
MVYFVLLVVISAVWFLARRRNNPAKV